jgi:hypothetical protein
MAVKAMQIDAGFDPEMRDALVRSEPVIDRVLGAAADRVEVSWEPGGVDAEGDPLARIRLTDAGVSRTHAFTAWDLVDEGKFRRQIFRLWDSILAERLDRQREAVLRSFADAEEG